MPVAAVALVWLNWRLAVIMLLLAPSLACVAKNTAARARIISRTLIQRGSLVYSELGACLSAVSLIKAFATEAQERRRFALKLKETFDSQMQHLVLSTSASALMSLSVSAGLIVCTWRGVWDVHLSRMTLGDYVAFCGYIGYILGPTRTVATIHVQLQEALTALARVVELLDSVPEDLDDDVKIALTPIRGEVEFRDVCFAYDGKNPTLSRVSFRALPGQKVAIVGPSGSGKTTLVSLLIRLYRPSGGRILVDGYDVEELKLKPLRERIGIVSQDVMLVDDTILNNIAYGTPSASPERVREAARLASADRFILALPNGYQTIVGERGVKLSAGERQRISLARVLTKDPDIVILDEPTAALDSVTEEAIKQALSAALSTKTTFIVAHRLSTVMSADKILVLHEGRVIQSGSHAELVRSNGLYRQMHQEQCISQPCSVGPEGNVPPHTTAAHVTSGPTG
jgi:ABC-type multidrug transport system fused ATPase/permease subunit